MVRRLAPWVVGAALGAAASWAAADPPPLPVAVNISAPSFQDPRIPEQIDGLLDLWGVLSDQLDVEITETAITSDSERATDICRRLREMGVRVTIDDFGTGHSPLVYLQRLGPRAIKIDISFVREVARSTEAEAIVQAIVDLGKRLNVTTVAEGVEDEETYAPLQAMGCDEVQGFFVSHPLPADELAGWYAARR